MILAVGLAPGRLGIAGEETFEGQDPSYCAACDGPLYRGQPVMVAGADRWAIAEAHELSSIASQVILVTQGGMPPAMDAGFAVQPGRIIALDFAPATLIRDPDGRLVTDTTQQCGLPGLCAAGDARAGAGRTVAAAIADGHRAALAARDMVSPTGQSLE